MLIIATTGAALPPHHHRAKPRHLHPPGPLFAHHPVGGLPHPADGPFRGPRPLLYPLHYSGFAYQDPYHNTPAFYNFEHTVQDDYSGTYFGHREAREGHLTEGSYFVHLPDGRLQTVTYYADGTGFHPTVTYEGDALYN
ncbi:adult-specific cuticular protein ACP-20-like [Panulirus ornatus]|uniref:adult-specific cuticular protein ACP-20-like n=1 Tax=Panulirus ornatus TaxID=150431 RepID=UPI003A8C2E5B